LTKITASITDAEEQAKALSRRKGPDRDGLTRAAGRGALWQLLGAGWSMFVQLGSSVVLARVLFPEDFGMMGMAIMAKGLIKQIGDLGTGTGLIAKKDVTQEDLSTAFWISIVVQGTLFLVAFAVAPLVALFFRLPALTWVMRAVSVGFLFSAVTSVSGTLLSKELRFGVKQVIDGVACIVQAGVAIFLAVVLHLEYWSLVLGMLSASIVTMVATIACAGWLPSFRFSRGSFKFLFRYGINNLGYSLVGYFHNNIDYLIVGRVLGPAVLGLYEFAYRLPSMLFNRLAKPVGAVVFPTLAKAQASDEYIAAGYIKTAKYVSIVVFPVLGGLAALARPAVTVLWGEKWLPIILPLQMLCLGVAIRCIANCTGAIFLCKDRPDLPFKFSLMQLMITFAAVGSLGYKYGLNGVALGMVIGTMPWLYVTSFALRMIHCSPLRLAKALGPFMVATAGCVALAVVVRKLTETLGLPTWSVLVCAVLAGVLGYLSVILIWFPDEVKGVRETIRIILKKAR